MKGYWPEKLVCLITGHCWAPADRRRDVPRKQRCTRCAETRWEPGEGERDA